MFKNELTLLIIIILAIVAVVVMANSKKLMSVAPPTEALKTKIGEASPKY